MTADEQVTHPEVTHPDTITLKVAQERPKANSEAPRPRTVRNRFRVPPPRVVAAVALVVAAVELLIWQVGGLVWGVAVHAGLAAAGLAAAGVVLWWRRRSARRLAGRVPGQAATPPPAAAPRSRWKNPFSRLIPGRKGKSPATGGQQQGRPGLLSRLFPGRRGGAGSAPGWSAAAGRPAAAGGRSPLGRLFSPGRKGKSPKSGSAPATGRGRQPGTSTAARTTSPSKSKRPFWDDFMRGLRGGQPARADKRRPSPGPTGGKHKAEDTKDEKAATTTTEELVKEAVKKAADAKEKAPVPVPRGGVMGDMNRIRAAASELAAALRDYDPESMHHLVRDIPGLGDSLAEVAAGVRQMASRAESEWPVAAPVAEALRSVAADIRAGAGTAEEARVTLHRENEVDIERGVAPRHGSRDIEAKWDVRGAE